MEVTDHILKMAQEVFCFKFFETAGHDIRKRGNSVFNEMYGHPSIG